MFVLSATTGTCLPPTEPYRYTVRSTKTMQNPHKTIIQNKSNNETQENHRKATTTKTSVPTVLSPFGKLCSLPYSWWRVPATVFGQDEYGPMFDVATAAGENAANCFDDFHGPPIDKDKIIAALRRVQVR
jgi:hypothetical protein